MSGEHHHDEAVEDHETREDRGRNARRTYHFNKEDVDWFREQFKVLKDPDPASRPKWVDNTISLQWVLGLVLAGLVAFSGWTVNAIIEYQKFQQAEGEFRDSTKTAVTTIQSNIIAINDQMNILRQSVLQVREQTTKSDAYNNQQNIDQTKAIAGIDKDLAILQERVRPLLPPEHRSGAKAATEFGLLDGANVIPGRWEEVPHLGVPIRPGQR